MYKNVLIIPHRTGPTQSYFKDASVDEVVDFIGNYIEISWRTYIRFHTDDNKQKTLKNKFKIYIKGYDNNLLDNDIIPLQHGDIVILFMINNIPENFYKSLEFGLAGLRYNAVVPKTGENNVSDV